MKQIHKLEVATAEADKTFDKFLLSGVSLCS